MSEFDGLKCEGTLNLGDETNGFEKFLGIAKFELSVDKSLVTLMSKDKGMTGFTLSAAPSPKETTIDFAFQQFNKQSAGLAFSGDVADLNSASGSVTDEVVVAKLGKGIPLANKNIASGVVVKNSAGDTTYVLGTDYAISYSTGLFYALAGGGIADLQSLKVSYSHNAISGYKVSAENKLLVDSGALFDGTNLANGDSVIITFPRLIIATKSKVNFVDDKFSEFTATATPIYTGLLDENGKPYLYKIEVIHKNVA